MALNKFMHPRNIYKTPPDFVALAKNYPEFSNIAKMDVQGKVTLDFKDTNSLRILTKCLLKSDFNLDVDIPEDRLVPTLPLRLNYILWIEDLLNAISRTSNVHGIDIGTGACAIYPLIAATKNKWHMIGTEADEESFEKARDNIRRNNLQNYVQLKMNKTSSLVQQIILEDDPNIKYDFCMCNPPFYSNIQELCESRNPSRPPPKNAFTGSPQELVTEGGELEFCRKLISESKLYRDNILIYTTMVGHKYNAKELIQDLKSEGINHTSTEFCQGRVTRWGVAWTFQNTDIFKLVPPPRHSPRKKILPLVYLLPKIPGVICSVDDAVKKIKSILDDLKITYRALEKKGNSITYDVTAHSNTWSNQRRLRRLLKRIHESEESDNKKLKNDVVEQSNSSCPGLKTNKCSVEESVCVNSPVDNSSDITDINTKGDVKYIESKLVDDSNHNSLNVITTKSDPILHALFRLFKKNDDILFEMEHLDGAMGKDGLHQILQYIKNNWK